MHDQRTYLTYRRNQLGGWPQPVPAPVAADGVADAPRALILQTTPGTRWAPKRSTQYPQLRTPLVGSDMSRTWWSLHCWAADRPRLIMGTAQDGSGQPLGAAAAASG